MSHIAQFIPCWTTLGWKGDARLFKLYPPFDGDEYLIVSIKDDEVAVFRADFAGRVLSRDPIFSGGGWSFTEIFEIVMGVDGSYRPVGMPDTEGVKVEGTIDPRALAWPRKRSDG